ncbi:TPA: YbfB/YjiJ family MFS transporter [Candidatus Bathyarchaeota archaeon]|nr:YbfB/YjiJ family MFS transporter [Candidatus Bathyarchaeota archaeon]
MVRVHYSWIIAFAGMLGVLVGLGFARFGYTPILEPMREGLGLSYTHMGLIASANFLGYVSFSMLGGYLASKYGGRRVAIYSLLLIGATMILTGLVRSFADAVVARFLTGVGSAGVNVSFLGLVSSWFGKTRRGLATGIMNAGSSMGIIIVGIIIPLIILNFQDGWRVGWFFLGAAGIVIAAVSYTLVRDKPEELGLKPVGAEKEERRELSLGMVYRSKTLLRLGLVYILFGFSYIIFATFYSAHIILLGYSIELAGGFWALVGVLSIFSGPFWGTVSDRIGRNYGLATVYTLLGISFIIFGFSKGVMGLTVASLIAGITIFSIPTIVQAFCGDLVGTRAASAAIGFVTVFFGIGQMVGPGVGGYLADLTGSFMAPLTLAGIAAIMGGLFSLFLKHK